MTLSHQPERTAIPAKLADETARIERAHAGQLRSRTLHALCQQAALLADCPYCGARPGGFCLARVGCWHLARFARAFRRGLLSGGELGIVLDAAGDVFTAATIIQDGAR